MMFGYVGDRAWWQAAPMPIATIAFWGLPISAVYSVITGVAWRAGPRAWDRGHRCDDARRILGGRPARSTQMRMGGSARSFPRAPAAALQAAGSPMTPAAAGTVTA